MASFVLCASNKNVAGDAFGTEVGDVSYLEVPLNADLPAPMHALSDAKTWLQAIADEAFNHGKEKKLDVVFFVHGYNTNHKEALLRQRLVQTELNSRGYECVVVGFDWPTSGSALTYELDRFKAQKAAAMLVTGGIIPFTQFLIPNCPINVHLMAHSMGAFVVREAFRAVDKIRSADLSNDWRIGQLVLFAADISSGCFALGDPEMLPVFNHCGRLTNYFSGFDRALAVSNAKNIDIDERVGRVGMPVDTPAHDKAIDVDCGPRYAAVPVRTPFKHIEGMVSHSWYLEDSVWFDDLAYTLEGSIDRNAIRTRHKADGNAPNDFVLNTA